MIFYKVLQGIIISCFDPILKKIRDGVPLSFWMARGGIIDLSFGYRLLAYCVRRWFACREMHYKRHFMN